MNPTKRLKRMWRAIYGQLQFKGLGCCGSSWNCKVSDTSIDEEEEEARAQLQAQESFTFRSEELLMTHMSQGPRVRPMNLAMALEADRHLLKACSRKRRHEPPLMRLFEEIDGPDRASSNWYKDSRMDGLCCVCMERNKDAALIPCGHAYCRLCSRELWLNRGSCPLCNRPISDVLDIF